MEQAYYTVKQAIPILQMSEQSIQRKVKQGLIPRAEWSGKILIPAWWIEKGGQIQAVSTDNQ